MASSRLRILLADDHPVVLAGIKSLITAEQGLEVVGEARDGITALEMGKTLRPDIAVIDISMPGIIGTSLAEQMRNLAHIAGSLRLRFTRIEDT